MLRLDRGADCSQQRQRRQVPLTRERAGPDAEERVKQTWAPDR